MLGAVLKNFVDLQGLDPQDSRQRELDRIRKRQKLLAGAGVVLGRGVLEPGLKFAPPDLEPSPVARGWQFAPEADVPAADGVVAAGAFAVIALGVYAGFDLNNYRQTGKKGLFTGMGADAGDAIGDAYLWDPSIGLRTPAESKINFDQYLGWKAIDIMAGPIPDAMSASKSATKPATAPAYRARPKTPPDVQLRRCQAVHDAYHNLHCLNFTCKDLRKEEMTAENVMKAARCYHLRNWVISNCDRNPAVTTLPRNPWKPNPNHPKLRNEALIVLCDCAKKYVDSVSGPVRAVISATLNLCKQKGMG